MNFKRIGLLIGILIVFMIAIQIVNKSEKQKGETEGKLFNLDQEKVVRLELVNKFGTFIFQKQNINWMIESPIKTKADAEIIEDILDNFSTLKYEREVGNGVGQLGKYGLDSPELKLKIYEEGIETPVFIIQIGGKNPLDSTFYTKLSKKKKIVLTAGYKRDHLDKDLFDFRYKRLTDFDFQDVKALDFTYQGKKIVLEKKKKTWFLEHPLFSVAKESFVEEIIHDTNHLQAKSFWGKSSTVQLKKLGFPNPMLELNVILKKGRKILKVVRSNDQYLAFTPDFEEIVGIEKNYIKHFNKELNDFREYKIARFYSFEVREIRYRERDFFFIIQKDINGTWRWIQPVLAESIDENRVNDFLLAFENLEAESFIDRPSGREKFLFHFDFKMKNEGSGKHENTIKISLSDIEENLVVARNADLPYLFAVTPDIIKRLPKKIDQFFQKDSGK